MASAPESRVLVLATTFPARAGDGTPEFVLTLSEALSQAGFRVTAVVPRVRGAAAHERVNGVQVRRFAYFPRRWETLADGAIMANLRVRPSDWLQVPSLLVSFLVTTWRVVREERPDVIHAHWIVPAGLVARLLRPLTGVPYVVTVHGADAYTLRTGIARSLKCLVVRGALSTVPVSEAIGQELRSLGRVGAAVPMGVDVAAIRARVGLRRPERGRVLFVGRLVEKKGVDVMLAAAARLPDVRLVVAGGGPLLEALRVQSTALGLSNRVEFLGHCTRDQVLEQFTRAQLVVMPSRVGAGGDQDGVPIVLGEAMAAGVPVLASRQGGLAEHISNNVTGRLVTPGSVEELAAALHDLVADPEAAERLARGARAHVEQVLDIGAVRDRYLEVFARSGVRPPERPTG